MSPAETTSRLRRLANDWREEEKQLCDQFGNEIIPRSMRARRIKDTKVLDAAVEMIERLEAAEADALEQARLNGMGASREAALMAKLEAAEKDIALKEKIIDALRSKLSDIANERYALRIKIKAMEKREPVAFRWELKAGQYTYVDKPEHASKNARIVPLYLTPGAKGEEK